nr:SGNH hydrolase-type esterase domain-containing protein [Tanacetum cinerariifolium]
MDEDLFTYKIEIPELANIPRNLEEEDDLEQRMAHRSDDGLEYNPSNVEFTKWLASKFHNHRTMDWYTKNALWIYWARGDGEFQGQNIFFVHTFQARKPKLRDRITELQQLVLPFG